jgi:hypothetical protein
MSTVDGSDIHCGPTAYDALGDTKQGKLIMPNITPEESFLIQAHALAECYVRLGELEVRKDPLIFNNIDRIYGPTGKIMAADDTLVFQGQGTLISVFYMLLVLPCEWQKNKIGDFDKLDLSCPKNVASVKARVTTDTYPNKNQALRHFRNALSHGRIDWSANGELVIKDSNPHNKEHSYTANYSMMDLGELAQSLSMAVANYIKTVIGGRQA